MSEIFRDGYVPSRMVHSSPEERSLAVKEAERLTSFYRTPIRDALIRTFVSCKNEVDLSVSAFNSKKADSLVGAGLILLSAIAGVALLSMATEGPREGLGLILSNLPPIPAPRCGAIREIPLLDC